MLRHILKNPELMRLFRIKLRPKSVINYAVLALLIYGGIMAVAYYTGRAQCGFTGRPFNPQPAFNNCFSVFAGIRLAIVSIFGALLATQNICMEREKHTLDFQRLVAMGPHQLALGKLFGAGLEAFSFGLMGLPFTILAAVLGAVPLAVFIQVEAVIVIFALTASALGLLCSSVVDKASKATGLMMLFGLLGWIFAAVSTSMRYDGSLRVHLVEYASPIRMLDELFSSQHVPHECQIFGFSVPMILCFAFFNAVVILFCYAVISRRLADEEFAYLAPWHVTGAFLLLQGVLIEDVIDFRHSYGNANFSYHLCNGLFLLAAAFAVTPSSELLRARINRGTRDQHWRILFERANKLQDAPGVLTLCLLALGYCAFTLVVANITNMIPRSPALALTSVTPALMFGAMGIAMAGTLAYLQVCSDRIGFRMAFFFLILALVLPPGLTGIAASVSEDANFFEKNIVLISPFAYLEAVPRMQSYEALRTRGVGAAWSCPLICAVLAAASIILTAMRIRFLLDINAITQEKKAKTAASEPPVLAPAAEAVLK